MACPCCLPPRRCPVCNHACVINAANYLDAIGDLYYGRGEFQIEHVAQCPAVFGYPGSYKVQQLWKFPYVRANNVAPPDIPVFEWKQRYPGVLAGCIVYWVLDTKVAAGYGDCCSYNGYVFNCDNRTGACDSKGNFRWRLMMIDCVQQSIIDITDEAITKIGIFEGSWNGLEQNTLGDRGCQSVVWTAMPEYFASPEVDCDV